MLKFLPEFLLVGLQKFHADEFGFDFDNKEAKEKQLEKIYDLLDDYLDPENEEGGDNFKLPALLLCFYEPLDNFILNYRCISEFNCVFFSI